MKFEINPIHNITIPIKTMEIALKLFDDFCNSAGEDIDLEEFLKTEDIFKESDEICASALIRLIAFSDLIQELISDEIIKATSSDEIDISDAAIYACGTAELNNDMSFNKEDFLRKMKAAQSST